MFLWRGRDWDGFAEVRDLAMWFRAVCDSWCCFNVGLKGEQMHRGTMSQEFVEESTCNVKELIIITHT